VAEQYSGVVDLALVVRSEGVWTIVEADGEIDLAAAPSLRERLIGLINEGHQRLVVDLDNVQFLDSTGLGVLVGALKRVRLAGGELRLVVNTPRIRKVFEVTRLDLAFEICESVSSAVGSLPGGG
jgi:anti-sigma B factor antagonist